MWFPAASVFLVLWVVGRVGVYDAGELLHLLLLAGGFCLLLGVLRARDAATRTARAPDDRDATTKRGEGL